MIMTTAYELSATTFHHWQVSNFAEHVAIRSDSIGLDAFSLANLHSALKSDQQLNCYSSAPQHCNHRVLFVLFADFRNLALAQNRRKARPTLAPIHCAQTLGLLNAKFGKRSRESGELREPTSFQRPDSGEFQVICNDLNQNWVST